LNGGPGCSSLGGFFQEHGPFVLKNEALEVTLNPYSWNVVANVLYIEQPAGIGFSYPAGAANDAQTASDTVDAIAAFLAFHPELDGRELYIAGESYGGHYVPNTAKAIEVWNSQPGQKQLINLKGIAVGNGYADWELDFNKNVPFARYHALSSTEQFAAADAACEGDFARCFWPRPDKECPAACDAAVHTATTHATDGSIDIYDIYEDVCLTPGHERIATAPFILEQERRSQVAAMRQRNAAKSGGKLQTTPISPIYPTCVASYNTRYLNLPAVQAAIHVDPTTINPKNGGNWSDCGGIDYDFGYESELPNYKTWTTAKVSVSALSIVLERIARRPTQVSTTYLRGGLTFLSSLLSPSLFLSLSEPVDPDLLWRCRFYSEPHGEHQLDHGGAEQQRHEAMDDVAWKRWTSRWILRGVRWLDVPYSEGCWAFCPEGQTAPRARHAGKLSLRHAVRRSQAGGDATRTTVCRTEG
jgi:hypothetical protein